MSLTENLSSYIVRTEFSDFPPEVVQKAKECFLDSLGAMLGGSQIPSSRIAAQFAHTVFGPGQARIVGTGYRVSPVGAAWANATSNSALDIDDVHAESMGHPGAVIFPAALAFAQGRDSIDGKRFLEAVVSAYEVAVRVGASRSREKRFSFSTGSWGAFAAAVATGKLLGLNKEQMGQALGITTAHHPLPPNRKAYLNFGMVKEATGWAVLTGSSAALLAQMGFSGMEPILDDPAHHDASVFDDLGEDWKILKTGFKLYPSCRWNHTTLDATLRLRDQHKISPGEVKEVVIQTFLKASQMTNPRPETIEDAQYALPFLVGLVLRYGELNPAYFLDDSLTDPKTLEVASKVRVELDPELEALFPSKFATSVEIMTERGLFKSCADRPRGDDQDPLSLEDLKRKFKTLIRSVLSRETASRVTELILNTENQVSFEWLDSLTAKEQ